MSTLMELLNGVLRVVFDLLLYPFRGLHPMVGLTVVSTIAAMLMLLGYRATSNQEGIDAVKKKIAAGLFEIRLFNDDLRAILRAQGAILRHNLEYMRLNLVPMFWMIVPFVLAIAQLQFHYGYQGLAEGDTTLLEVRMQQTGGPPPDMQLQLPEGLRLDSERVWAATIGEASWRLVAEQSGVHEIGVTVQGETFTKQVVVSDRVQRRAPARQAPNFLDQLLYPAEPPLPANAPVVAIEIRYAEREVGLFGFDTHWLIVFLILSIAIAFALKGRFGVTI